MSKGVNKQPKNEGSAEASVEANNLRRRNNLEKSQSSTKPAPEAGNKPSDSPNKSPNKNKRNEDDAFLRSPGSSSSGSHSHSSPSTSQQNKLKLEKPIPGFQLFSWLLVFRWVNAAVLRTSFNPDEQWQSLEPASFLAFGHGYLTWEWASCIAIRGWLHPLVFGGFYQALLYFQAVLEGFGLNEIALSSLGSSLGLDNGINLVTGWTVAYGPRFFQAVFAAATDYLIYQTAKALFAYSDVRAARTRASSSGAIPPAMNHTTETKARIALFLSMFSWFHGFALVRTFSSCFELFLTLAGVYWVESSSSFSRNSYYLIGIIFGALACVVRPTAGLFWLPYGCMMVYKQFRELMAARKKKRGGADVGGGGNVGGANAGANISGEQEVDGIDLMTLFTSMARVIYQYSLVTVAIGYFIGVQLDSIVYALTGAGADRQRTTISALNFFEFNVAFDGGKFYGSHPVWWYFLDGLGGTLLTFFPLSIYGIYLVLRHRRNRARWQPLLVATAFTLLGLSATSHKEHRFLLPIQWVFLLFAAEAVCELWFVNWRRIVIWSVLVQILVGGYFILVHQQGADQVMTYLREELAFVVNERVSERDEKIFKKNGGKPADELDELDHEDAKKLSVFFLTPCHATPLYSYLHEPVNGCGGRSPPPSPMKLLNIFVRKTLGWEEFEKADFPTAASEKCTIMDHTDFGFLDCSPALLKTNWRDRFVEAPVKTMDTLFTKDLQKWHAAKNFCDLRLQGRCTMGEGAHSVLGGLVQIEELSEPERGACKMMAEGEGKKGQEIITVNHRTYPYETLPDYLIFHSSVFHTHEQEIEILRWLSKYEYTLRKTFFDSFHGEGFYGNAQWIRFYVFVKKGVGRLGPVDYSYVTSPEGVEAAAKSELRKSSWAANVIR